MEPVSTMGRYDQLRAIRRAIHNRLLPRIPKALFERALDEISVYLDDSVDLGTPTGEIVLVDFILYHIRQDGKTLIEQELEAHAPPEGGDERLCLEAMTHAVYGLVQVLEAKDGMGILGQELRSGAEIFVYDRSMGSTVQPGCVIAGNLVCTDGLWSFTGGMLLLPEDVAFSVSLLPPSPPSRERLDMLYGGKAPPEVVAALAEAERELEEQVERLERREERRKKGKAKKSKSTKPKSTKPKSAPKPPDPNEDELDAAANVIAMAMEGGAGEITRYV